MFESTVRTLLVLLVSACFCRATAEDVGHLPPLLNANVVGGVMSPTADEEPCTECPVH